MEKKWFIRGFGVGVLFAAAILGISFMVRTSDTYVKSRARELGMEYASPESDKVLADRGTAEPEGSPQASPGKSDSTSKPQNTQAPKKTSGPANSSAPEKSSAPAGTKAPSSTGKPASSSGPSQKEIDMKKEKDKMEKSLREEEKKLTINAGEWSSDVCKKLEQMGVIKSASDFDMYLEKNGYSGGISAGTYKVSKGDTYSELAKKITGK